MPSKRMSGYIAMRWNQHNWQGTSPAISERYRLPSVARAAASHASGRDRGVTASRKRVHASRPRDVARLTRNPATISKTIPSATIASTAYAVVIVVNIDGRGSLAGRLQGVERRFDALDVGCRAHGLRLVGRRCSTTASSAAR